MEQLMSFFAHIGELPFLLRLAGITRYLIPALGLWILIRCARSMLQFKKEPEVWAWLATPAGDRLPVTHWENLLGRARGCDVLLEYSTISRQHAVLTRYDDGSWSISDVGSKGGIEVNGKPVSFSALSFGDVVSLGGVTFTLVPITQEQENIQARSRTRAGREVRPSVTLALLSVFEVLLTLELAAYATQTAPAIAAAFAALIAIEWLLFLAQRLAKRSGFDVETLAFYLTSVCLAVVSSSAPLELRKTVLSVAAGLVVFLVVGWSLRDLERAKKIRYLAAVAGLTLMAVNLIFGVEQFGARNWISIAGVSLQPSELAKICFVFVGASTLQRLMAKRNLILFIAYSAIICGCLALINDFGTALIFFVAFLVIAFLRSGNFATIALAIAAVGFAGVIVLRFKPYALSRFAAWGHVWDNAATSGYSQTRAMMCIASGGLFGLGGGNGWLKYVGAADTDLVFALVCEEWGLLLAMTLVVAIVVFVVFVVRSAPLGRSCFYTIGACAAVTLFAVQVLLNVFGTVDFLPLTGVTFPFVSNGGSSMLCSWGLLAFVKAADTRQNASFAVKLPTKEAAA